MRPEDLPGRAFEELKEVPGRKTLGEFKSFLLRGNVVDLAVAVVIGVAFNTVVQSLVKNLLTPLIAIPGKADFSDYYFEVSGSRFDYGVFLNDLIAFILVSAAVFFFVVKPIGALMRMRKTETNVEDPKRECPECLSKIPAAASRCAFCTAEVASA